MAQCSPGLAGPALALAIRSQYCFCVNTSICTANYCFSITGFPALSVLRVSASTRTDRNTRPRISRSLSSSQVQVTMQRCSRADLGNQGGSALRFHQQKSAQLLPEATSAPLCLPQAVHSTPCSGTGPVFMKLHGQTQREFLTPKLFFGLFLTGSTLTWEGAPQRWDCFILEGTYLDQLILITKSHPQLLTSTKDVDADTRTNSRDLAHAGMLFSKLVKPISGGSRSLNFYLAT